MSIEANSRKTFDSLKSLASTGRMRDSLAINMWSDSIRAKVNKRFSLKRLNHFGDSLRAIGFPEPRIATATDSLLKSKTLLLREVGNKQRSLQEKVSKRYISWTTKLREKFNLDSTGVQLPGVNLPANSTSLPGTEPPSANLPEMPPIPSLGTEDFSSLGISPELVSVGGPIAVPSAPELSEWQKSLPTMPDPVGDFNEQVQDLKGLSSDPSIAAEKAVKEVSEVSAAAKELSEAEKMKEQADAMKETEKLKDLSTIKEQAVDHFAGKEAELKGAMGEVSKYKRKYASLGSLSEIPKNSWLPRNGLKSRPFRERFRTGLNMGFQSNRDTILLDFYPNASYRITGRFEAGLGAIYRIRIATNPLQFDQKDPVWGVHLFVLVKTFKSVFVRLETDGTSHVVKGSGEQGAYRDWRWSFHSGIQTNFKLSKRLTGNVQMLYNFDSSLKDGFPERLTARAGVQYALKKRP